MPAIKQGHPPRWRIERSEAATWLAAHRPGATPGPGTVEQAAQPAQATADLDPLAEAEAGISKHIDRLDLILEAFTDLLFNAQEFDPRLVTSVKSISTELRRLDLHRLDMRKADAELMDRSDHMRVLGTFARLVVDEIQAWARSTPDGVVDVLTAAGVRVKAKRVIKLLDREAEAQATNLRERIMDAVEQAGDIE